MQHRVEFGMGAAAGSAAALLLSAMWLPLVPIVLFALTVLVLVHEGGHLVAARRAGMHATEFFAGFGPVVLAWRTKRGLRVGIKAIPAGGYVKLVGMTRREDVAPGLEPTTFRAASRPRRLAVVAAGPAVNLLLGFGLLLLPGGDPGKAWDATYATTAGTVEGLGQLVGDLDGYVGAVADPAEQAADAPTRFLSPVGVAQIGDDVADAGGWTVVRLIAIVSIGLGIMNLLPLPPLDGGHAAVVLVESVVAKIRRRPDLRYDVTTPVFAALTGATLLAVLALGASALVLDIASPVSL